MEFRKRFRRERPVLFKSGQCLSTRTIHQSTTPSLPQIIWPRRASRHVPHPPESPDLAPCNICLIPKLRDCRYETIEELKEAVTKVIDTITQEDFHGAFQKLLERYKMYIAVEGDYFKGDIRVLSINVPIRKKSGNLSYAPPSFNSGSRIVFPRTIMLWAINVYKMKL